jgi:prepilin-type N-terminal cleavage/methylation domain-containing protein
MMHRRPGVTLIELLLAVALTGLLTTAATAVLRSVTRAMGRAAIRDRAEALADEALAVAGAMIEAAVDATVLGDTALHIVSLVTDGIACADGTLVRLDSAGPEPAPGDRWVVLERGVSANGSDSLVWRSVSPMPLASGGMACAIPDPARLLVRVVSDSRLVPYRNADGVWMLGLRRCFDRCEPAQPLVGPIHPPAEGGWQLRPAPCGIDVGVRAVGGIAVRWRLVPRC